MEGTVDTTTPVATTEAAPAAPATSAPASVQTTSERPSSMLEALEQAAAKQEQPTAETGAPAATAPDAVGDPAGVHATAKGPIPFEVHETALKNARAKEREAALTEWRAQYGWAEQVPKATLDHWSTVTQEMSTNPIQFLDRFTKELSAHPVYGPQLRSHAARTLGARQAEQEPQPDVQIVDAQGNVTGQTFSAQALAKRDAWRERQLFAKVDERLQPLTAEREQREQAAITEQRRVQIETHADGVMEELTQILDGDHALFEDVHQVMAQHPDWSAHRCALEVRKTKIVPSLEEKARLKAVETFKHKTAGNTASGTGATAAPKRPTNATELAAWMEAHA